MRFSLLASGLAGGLLLAACDDTPPDRVALEDVAVSGHRFVAVGTVEHGWVSASGAAVMLTSEDGLTWERVVVEARTRLSTVAVGDGVILVGGGDEYDGDTTCIILRSTDDGETWAPVGSVPSEPILDIAYGDGVFVAVGPQQIHRSDDGGQTWSKVWQNEDELGETRWNRVGYGGGVFIRTDQSEHNWISSDGGITWEEDLDTGLTWVETVADGMIGGVINPGWNSGDGTDGPITVAIATSSDGHGWTETSDPPGNNPTSYGRLGDAQFSPGLYGLALDDGSGWSLLREGSFSSAVVDDDRVVIVGDGKIVLGTAAGEWTDVALPDPSTFGP